MASEAPEHGSVHAQPYNDTRATVVALLGAILIDLGIIALFVLITWFAHATS
ncbi:hypothetical protein GON03_05365 [Nocardioides sp. MAH-18]|uniref:Uncharacterized protein n=1 Tax=Nocardioides agri TaxID=2682843 RepID=A0A6L6XMS5_9ACTN|nr:MULTISPECIES: hypothetical protein [unclassified Nocardioides]MBA2953737.1 hypothetical protein [Nocardioides sp. CGMCC 1.13656]MVQ48601.1 hypothetical protein [Nocardioides sp. MAH-18]